MNVRRVAKNTVRVLGGLLVGVGLAEVAFHVRDDGAFPHVNLYEVDSVLGVRLLPGSSMKIAFGGNRTTSIRINGEGFRGDSWPTPGGDDVLVLGDSQVFGLGVEESETFAARLRSSLGGAHVINQGIPTYGPPEFEILLERALAERKPKRVLYVVNVANDLFEADRPNAERHAVWDGWAVRKETAPASVLSFPGRDALFRTSHAVFAMRRWLYRSDSPQEAFSAPSEGTWKDIGSAAARAADAHEAARDETRKQIRNAKERSAAATKSLQVAQSEFLSLVEKEHLGGEAHSYGVGSNVHWDPVLTSFAQPGDIVGDESFAEFSRPVFATVQMILDGAKARVRVEEILRERARAKPDAEVRIAPVLDRVGAAQKSADAIRSQPIPRAVAWSPLAPRLRRAKELCDGAGARLFVVVLPLDVQVSADEWAKYGRSPIDLAPSKIILDDIVAVADDLGVSSIDLTTALAHAEPGAFLDRDIHMSAKGHEAVAGALATMLASKPPVKLLAPSLRMPVGRTPPTALADARSRNEVTVYGSTDAGCETYIVDEWLTLRCHDGGIDKAMPTGVAVREAPLGESVTYRDGTSAVVVQVPVLKAMKTVVDFRWPSRSRRLDVSWKGSNVTIGLSPLPADGEAISDVAGPRDAVCACEKDVWKAAACGQQPLFDNPACTQSYPGDCKSMVECMRGNREIAPACPKGAAPVGVFQRCAPMCGDEVACAMGACVAYEGARVCL